MNKLLLVLLVLVSVKSAAQAPVLDPSFGKNGTSFINFYDSTSVLGDIAAYEVDDKGNIYLLTKQDIFGDNFYKDKFIIKINAQGTIDSSFYKNGYRQAGEGLIYYPKFIRLSPDKSKLYVFGNNASELTAVRLKLDGAIDSTFGTNGYINTKVNSPSIYDILILPDGGFIVTGMAPLANGNNVLTTKFKTNGTLDAAYNGTGETIIPFTDVLYKYINALLLPSGAVIINGVNGKTYNRDRDTAVLIKILPSGGLDANFGVGGFAKNISSVLDYVNDKVTDRTLLLQDTSILVIKSFNGNLIQQFKFTKEGKVDSTYAPGGVKQNSSLTSYAPSFIGRSRNPFETKVWMRGIENLNGQNYSNYITLTITADGNIDPSIKKYIDTTSRFNNLNFTFNNENTSYVRDTLINVYKGLSDMFARVGRLATSTTTAIFLSKGLDIKASREELIGLRPLSNGKMVGLAFSVDNFTLFGLDENGFIDRTFGNSGTRTIYDVGLVNNISQLAHVLVDKKDRTIIVVRKRNPNDDSYSDLVLRFMPNGSYDSSFAINGKLEITKTAFGVTKATLQSDDKVLLLYTTLTNGNRDISVTRLNQYGSFDNSFGNAGTTTFDYEKNFINPNYSEVEIPQNILQLKDSSIIVLGTPGYYGNKMYLVQLDKSGKINRTSGDSGRITLGYNATYLSFFLKQLESGKIIIGQKKYIDDGNYKVARTFRLNPDFSYDPTYNEIAYPTPDIEFMDGVALPSGKVYLTGFKFKDQRASLLLLATGINGGVDSTVGNNGTLSFPNIYPENEVVILPNRDYELMYPQSSFLDNKGRLVIATTAKKNKLGDIFLFANLLTNTTLSVNLINFSAQPSGENVLVKWITSAEKTTASYIVQHSTNNSLFKDIAVLPPKVNNGGDATYAFLHEKADQGNNYYRLKILDKDGTYTYSKLVRVHLNNTEQLKLQPNPVHDFLFITHPGATKGTVLKIIDNLGTIVKVVNVPKDARQTTVNTSGLTTGVYRLVVEGASKPLSETFIKK